MAVLRLRAPEPPQKLKRIAADTDANWIQDSLDWVDRDGQVVHTGEGQQLNFDALLIAVGARQIQAYEHVAPSATRKPTRPTRESCRT